MQNISVTISDPREPFHVYSSANIMCRIGIFTALHRIVREWTCAQGRRRSLLRSK